MNEPSDRIFALTYCSRNLVQGSPDRVREEIQAILAASRRNNPSLGITGALLYNAGSFAQVLEGPLANVQRIFETIQRDARHGDVIVIQSEFADCRRFPGWDMGFAGGSSIEGSPIATEAFRDVFFGVAHAGERLLDLLRSLMTEESEWLLPDVAIPA